MPRTRCMVIALGLAWLASPGFAATILPSATGTASTGAPWPAPDALVTHQHSFFGNAVNAGENGVEEERGLVEFNLAAESPAGLVLLLFSNAQFQSCCGGATGGSYSIGLYSYVGNNAFVSDDFYVTTTSLLGTFSTTGISVGQQFSFDVTAAFNANAGGSLGILLKPVSEPAQTSYTFNTFRLETAAAAVPEPSTMLMLASGLAGAAIRSRRGRRTRRSSNIAEIATTTQ